MTQRISIGIDPGASGAIAVLGDGELISLVDMPTSTRKAGGQQVNAAEVGAFLRNVMSSHSGASLLAVIEQVSAMPGQGVSSMFRFGEAVGVVRGVLGALRVPLLSVTPQIWKRHYGLIGAEKDVARTKAIELFPGSSDLLSRKKDVGRADALLIATWAYTTEQAASAA